MTDSAHARDDTVVPGYELLERVGSGGFGEVFRARHERIDREVAIKIIHRRHADEAGVAARFLVEARAVNKVRHPNIVEIVDVGELADGRSYCVMELIRGDTLRTVLEARGRLPLAEALPILAQIADAIDAAHAAGIAHRDLKPDNVFVLPDGRAKLIDFGLAKLVTEDVSVTQTGQVFGTPLYMSPEQCRGRGVTVATDRYSFGALAYHLLVGEPPFTGEPLDLAMQHINDRPTPPSARCSELTASVDTAVLALLAKDPAARPASCRTALAMLEAGAPRRRMPRRRTLVVAGAVLATAGVAAAVLVSSRTRAVTTAATHETWSLRTLRFDIDGVTTNPTLSSDGRWLIYIDDGGIWRRDLETGATSRLPLNVATTDIQMLEPMPDGRFLASRGRAGGVDIIDPSRGTRDKLLDASWPALSPNGQHVAAWRVDGRLIVYDLATRETRELATKPDDATMGCAPKWSPDGKLLLWGRTGFETKPERGVYRTYITNVADGATAPLTSADVPFRNTTTGDYFSPIAFLPDGRIAYCHNAPVEVRARALHGGNETTLAVLDDTVSDCMLASRGDRLVVALDHSQSTIGVMDLPRRPGQPGLFRNLVGPFHLRPLSADDRRVYAFEPRPGVAPGNLPPASVRAVDVATGDIATLPPCSGEDFITVRGGRPLRVRRTRATRTVELLDLESCAVVDQWTLPGSPHGISTPTCASTWCVIPALESGMVKLYKLVAGSPVTLLAELPMTVGHPIAAIAHDERDIALAITSSTTASIHLVPAAGGPPQRVDMPPAFIDGVAWDAEGRLLVAGQGIDGAVYTLTRITPEGTREALWTSKTTYLTNIMTDGSRQRLLGLVSALQQDFVVLDRTVSQGKRSD